MSGIGPSLPPHLLAKRKRQREESEQNEATTEPGAKRAKSPDTEQLQDEKRSRVVGPVRSAQPLVVGPTPPPAPLDERPLEPPSPGHDEQEEEAESSSDDDDFGPALPNAADLESAKSREEEALDRLSRSNDGSRQHRVAG